MSLVIFSADQRALLTAMLNRLIPAEPPFAGAGDAGVVDHLEALAERSPALRRLFLEGIDAVDLAAWQQTDRSFLDLADDQKDAVLATIEQTSPTFFEHLIVHTYRGYYVKSEVIALLGLAPRPPQPLGHVLPPFDPSLLDRVRARGAVYRKA